jgi:hypothetical protein
MNVLRDTEIDGVRCFWVETGRPTLAAQLLFRHGMADEPLPESGWLHLLEHLALHDRGGGSLQVNGSVATLLTSFDTHGPANAVAAHLTAVTGWLADPDFGELERERNVLRAEAQTRGGIVPRALGWRYGARGPGVCAYSEPGLARATQEALAARAQRVFTRGNAVLVMDGPPPSELRLTLHDGPLQSPAPVLACETAYPAAFEEGAGVVLSGEVTRSSTATLVPDLIQQELRRRLRDTAGAAYAPWSLYESVDDDRAVILAGSDLLPSLHSSVAEVVFSIASDLARSGPRAEDVQELVDHRAQVLNDPFAAFGLAVRAGHAVLNGRAPETFDEVWEQLLGTSAGALEQPLTELRTSLLLGLPAEAENATFRAIEFKQEPARARGEVFRNVNWPKDRVELVVGADRVELRADGVSRGVDLADVVGMFTFADGGRHVVRADGYGITIEPGVWRKGERAAGELDRLVPSPLHLPAPARDLPPIQRVSPAARTWARFREVSGFRMAAAVVAFLTLVLVVTTTEMAGVVVGLFWLASGAVTVVGLEFWRRRMAQESEG